MNDSDILELFREADSQPEPDVRRIDVDAAVSQGKRQRRAGLARRASVVTGAIAASIVGAVVVAGLPVFDDTPAGAPSASAAAVLNEAARNAGKADPTTTPRADQYIYTRTHAWVMNGVAYSSRDGRAGTPQVVDRMAYYLAENVHETWQPVQNPRGTTVIRTLDGLKRKPLRPSDAQYLKEAGVNLNAPPQRYLEPDPSKANNPKFKINPPAAGTDFSNPFVFPTPATLATLPTDADKLLARVRKQASDGGSSRDEEALDVITSLFQRADLLIGRDLRAALFRAAAKIPGIERGASVNLDGQRGIAIGRNEPVNGERREIIVDPATSRIIGERMVQVGHPAPQEPGKAANDDIPIGTVTNMTAVRSIIVDRPLQTTPAR